MGLLSKIFGKKNYPSKSELESNSSIDSTNSNRLEHIDSDEYLELKSLYNQIIGLSSSKMTADQLAERVCSCSVLEDKIHSIAISDKLREDLIVNQTQSLSTVKLKDFEGIESYRRTLFSAEEAIEAIKNKVLYTRLSAEKYYSFLTDIEKMPNYNIVVSDNLSPKGTVSSLDDIKLSNITARTVKAKLSNFVVFDTETTGLSAAQNEIIEIAAIRYRDFIPVERFESLCFAKKGIPIEASKINGITDEMVSGKPHFREIASSFQSFIGDDNLVAHNLSFDLKFITKWGVDTQATKRKYYDTLELSKKTLKKYKDKWDKELGDYLTDYESGDVENYKLETLCRYYGIPLTGSHRAIHDCYATGQLFCLLINDRIPG